MNRVQELIDERREEFPVGLAKQLLEACRDEAQTLYKVVATHIFATSTDDCVQMVSSQQTHVVEVMDVDQFRASNRCALDLFLREACMVESWTRMQLPTTVTSTGDHMLVIHSIQPFRKRARS
jgi:hypothetical protein